MIDCDIVNINLNKKGIAMYQIINNLPKPIIQMNEKHIGLKDSLSKMEIGQSIIVETENERKAALMHAKRRLNFVFITIKIETGGYQIYRDK